ncbi:hypothetical protein EG329_014150 [Mollisiaceae sp. DMI_Dod_QoI]|nr:hypothetical protein EG329_014150 [Helotiales sp. DMI_Dod_QoI]
MLPSKKATMGAVSSTGNTSHAIALSLNASGHAGPSAANTPSASRPSKKSAALAGSSINATSTSLLSSTNPLGHTNPLSKKASVLAHSARTSTQDIEVKFACFLKLPVEIQLMIWRIACPPRMVGLKPDKIPSVAHVCKTSREVAGFFFKARNSNIGICINPKTDILHLDKSSFSSAIGYHISAYHTLRCRTTPPSMVDTSERIALSINEVFAVWKLECFHCFLTYKFKHLFSGVKELIIILRPGPLGANYQDLYEVEKSDNPTTQTIIDDTKETFKHAQEDVFFKDVKLKFMRIEKWER